ncbi:translation initiation factor IF-2-like [Panicum virgatum]|nr:translation initiation factor IF-2-like [Panicum virgatum]
MAATSLSSSSPPRVTAKLAGVSRSSSLYTQLRFCSRQPFQKPATAAAFRKLQPELLLLSLPARNRHARTSSRATDNDQAAPAAAQETTTPSPVPPAAPSPSAEKSPVTPGNGQPQQPVANANGSAPSEPPKRAPLTARERLRAARVLGKYAEPSAKGASSSPSKSKSSKPEFGSGVLDALREADAKKAGGGGGRRGSRLPEAPGNLFDDSKRGMPKEGWTFELPFGVDVFLVLVSFTLITTIMFGTAFLVWKLGGIHFNEY